MIIGVMLLAAVLPLAAPPLAIFVVVESPLVVVDVAPFVSANAQPVALLALTFFRGPPSR